MNRTVRVQSFAILFLLLLTRAFSAPTGGNVTSGSAVISQPNASTTTITQSSDKAIINWGAFSINANELVQFLQPSVTSTTFNRVIGVDPSVILGTLQANGRLFLINPNGVLFGPGSVVNVGGLLATTLALSDSDFLNGNYHFTQSATNPLSYVVNQGTIQASPGGSIVLLAPLVSNEGVILAPRGRVGLGATTEAVVDYDGSGVINFVLPNPGTIPQNVTLSPQAFSQVIQNVVNEKNVVQANGVTQSNGQVILTGGEGIAINSGSINVNGNDYANAGSISVNSTQATVLTPTSVMQANGEGIASSGGRVRIFSEGNTNFRSGAQIEAKGGDTGNGGFVETSAKNTLWVNGSVDTSAVNGKRGTWLLDPTNLTITDTGAGTGTQDVNVAGGVLYATADNGGNTVSVGTLESQTSDILLQATNSITVNNIVSNGGTIPLQPNVSLEMDTSLGNITFTNTANSIVASGVGAITINSGGTATLGNLTAQTITINSVGNATIGNVNTTPGNTTGFFDVTTTAGAITQNASTTWNFPTINFLTQANNNPIGTAINPLITVGSTSGQTRGTNSGIFINNTNLNGSNGTMSVTSSGTNSPIVFNNTGSFGSFLTVEVNNSNATATSSVGESLIFNSATSVLTASAPNSIVNFSNIGGAILNSGALNQINAQQLALSASGNIGTAVQPLLTTTTILKVAAPFGGAGKVWLTNTGALTALTASTNNNDVTILDSVGDSLLFNGAASTLRVNFPNATVNFGNNTGSILNFGVTNNIVAPTLTLTVGSALKTIGTAGQSLLTTTSNLTLNSPFGGKMFVNNTGTLTSLAVQTDDANATVSTTTGNTLSFVGGGPDTLAMSMPNTNVTFINTNGSILNLGAGNNISAASLTLMSPNNIGTAIQPLLTSTTSLCVSDAQCGTYNVFQGFGGPQSFYVTNNQALSSLTFFNYKDNNMQITATGEGSLNYQGAGIDTLASTLSNTKLTADFLSTPTSVNLITNNTDQNVQDGTLLSFTGATKLLTVNAVGTDVMFNNIGGGLQLGTINVGGSNNATLTAAGVITNNGSSASVTANDFNLTGTTIGTSTTPLTLSATLGDVMNASATSNVLNITNLGDLTLGNVNANGAVTLNAQGGALLGTGTTNVSGSSVSLIASNGIGSGVQSLLTQTGTLSLTTTGANTASSYVNNNGTLSALSVATNNSDSNVTATGGSLTFTGATGLLNANLNGTNLTMNNTGGNLGLGGVNVGTSANATLIAAGSITNSNMVNNVMANTATLTAGSNIGTASNPIQTTINTLNAMTTNGAITLTNSQGITLNNVVTNGVGNDITIQSSGDMHVTSLNASGGFHLTAPNIYDAPVNNLVGHGNSDLTATTGVIGVMNGALWENVIGGTLTLSIGGSQDGVALNLNGLVNGSGIYLPSQLRVLNHPNAFGYYNEVCIFGPCQIPGVSLMLSAANALSNTSFWLEDSVKTSVGTLSFQGGGNTSSSSSSTSGNGNGGGDSSQCVDMISTSSVPINHWLLMIRDNKVAKPCSGSPLHSGLKRG